jgi:nucleotide-binding universal stress UspA family protein
MKTLRHVMAATDLSGPSRCALERARLIAASHDAACTAVHVVSAGALDELRHLFGDRGALAQEQVLAEARERLARMVGAPAAGVAPLGQRVVIGKVVDELVAQAGSLAAELVVLGARGEGFLRHLVLGTTAERVLRKLQRPVLVVRQMPYDGYRRVLVAVDFSPASAGALRLASVVAPSAERVLVHVYELPFEGKLHFAGVDESAIQGYRRRAEREALDRLEAFALDAGLEANAARLLVGRGDPSRVLIERQQEEGCDLIVVGKRGKGMVEELLLGSVTKHVLAECTTDVLVAVPPGFPPA